MRMIDGKPEYKNGLVSQDHVTLVCFTLTATSGDENNVFKRFVFLFSIFRRWHPFARFYLCVL